MKFHDELNQKLFNKEELKPEVKEKLKEIAEAFIDYLEVNKDAIKDVVITGSSVSYNYTKYSDIDLHLKVDYDLIHEDCPIVEGYLWACKSTFNKDHDITIYGIPVEVYAESIEEDTVHNGLYSLWQDKWIDKPNKIPPTDNDSAVLSKYNELKEAADRIQDSEVASELIDKIYQMRKAGLQEAGEFSTENLAFKKLRDEGIIERLREMKKQKIDKELSLESYNESDNDLTNFCIIIDGDYNWLEEYGTFKSCKAAHEWLDKNGEEGWMYSQLTKGEMKDLGIDKYGHVNKSIKESQEELIKEANKITNHGMLYMPVRKLAAKLMDRVKGTSDEEALKVAKMFFKETKNESIKEKLEEKEYQGCKYTILPDGKYCSIKIYAPKGYTFKNGDTWYSTETELKKADKKAKDIIDNEIELKESINKLEETLKKATDMEINEGMWASPFTIENAKQVAELLSKPITYEELNSEEGKQKYWNIIGDDEFWDNVADEAFDIPEADARYLIVKFLEDWIETKENFNPDAYSQKAEDIIKKAIFMFNGITEDMGKSIKEDRLFKKQLTPLPSKDAKLNKGDKVTIDGQNGEIIEVKPMKMSDTCTYKIKLDNGKVIWRYEEEIINEEVKTSSLQKTISRALAESEGIYKPSLIYAAYKLEQQWLKSLGLGQDEQAPEIMLFVINNPEEGIEDTKLVKREDVYTYTPEQNEYYLDMTRDSGDVITDYNLEPAAKLVDSWNLKEDAQTLTDKVDKAEQELQDIIKMVKVGYQEDNKLINNLNKLINEALEK